jgi:sulfate permease, SulP family
MPDPAPAPKDAAAHSSRRWPVFASPSGYRVSSLRPDLLAGITLAAIAIPGQMATARLGGFPPEIGFFAFIAGSLGFAFLGASRFLSAGADSTITPIFAGGLVLLAATGTPEYAGLAAALALVVGVILIGGGLFRLGWIADLLSAPVVTGFLAGIAVHILVLQLPGLMGIAAAGGDLPRRVAGILASVEATNFYALALGLGVLALAFASECIDPRIPGTLIGLVAATIAVMGLGLESRGSWCWGRSPTRCRASRCRR